MEFVCHLLFYSSLHVLQKILSVLHGILLLMLAYLFEDVNLGESCWTSHLRIRLSFVILRLLRVLHKIQLFSGGILLFELEPFWGITN